jgi:hypothetical protein
LATDLDKFISYEIITSLKKEQQKNS